MIFKQTQNLNTSKDFILACTKDAISSLKKYISIDAINFDGSFATHHLVYQNNSKIYLVGLGENKHVSKLEQTFQKFAFDTQQYWSDEIQLVTENLSDFELEKAILGFTLANYTIGANKTEQKETRDKSVFVISDKNIENSINQAYLIGATINKIKALVDAPPNIKTPEFLANWALNSAKTYNYQSQIINQEELEKQGFHAVLAVGKGSIYKPVVIVNQYFGNQKSTKIDLVLVGKGITFDAGGLSIKPSTNLHYMKSDMGGAAAVLGTIELVASLQLDINIVGIVGAAENAVDANSYRPGDVINSYAGKTIEIIDTDAEGRLVLADCINYAIKTFQPEKLIDLATLTGSVVRTLGYSAAGMFTKNEEMANQLSKIGEKVHERVWQLPLYEDFEEDLHSDIADIRNFSGLPIAGAINAAKFLEAFTENYPNWLHLDIAGVAFGASPYAKMKSATGYGIQLLFEYCKELSEKN